MSISVFTTIRQIITSAKGAHSEALEGVRRIDDVIDGVPLEAQQECGEILEALSHIGTELDRLDEIVEQIERIGEMMHWANTGKGNPPTLAVKVRKPK